jgi:hypothetical protein
MDATRRPPPTIDQLGLVGDDACAGGGRMVVRAADVPPHLGGCVVALPHVPPCSRARASQLESASLPVPAGQGRAGAGQGRCWDCLPQVRGGRRSGTGSRGRVLRCSQCTCGPSSAPARPEVMGGPSERTAGGGGSVGLWGRQAATWGGWQLRIVFSRGPMYPSTCVAAPAWNARARLREMPPTGRSSQNGRRRDDGASEMPDVLIYAPCGRSPASRTATTAHASEPRPMSDTDASDSVVTCYGQRSDSVEVLLGAARRAMHPRCTSEATLRSCRKQCPVAVDEQPCHFSFTRRQHHLSAHPGGDLIKYELTHFLPSEKA